MKTIRFGVIGLGLMGREFASAAARWCHLLDMPARPEIVAICNRSEGKFDWYTQSVPTIKQVTTDYKALLANPDVDAVYIAVPHNVHEEMYVAAIESGKALFGEKPFGMDQKQNDAIMAAMKKHPDAFVRCTSQFPFFPAVQQIGKMVTEKAFGRIIEVNAGFLHSSDLNEKKPINWKRMIDINGAYGCMGDLGMHVCHVPFRAGWIPKNVRAVLSDIVTERPDGKGGMAPCKTWDNATLFCETADADGTTFPMTLKTFRIAPGETNTWYIEVKGTKACARFSTKNPRRIEVLKYDGGEQAWQQIDLGYQSAYKAITGGIFEFGFSDAFQQMIAAFCHEMATGSVPTPFAGCARPEEVAISHRLFTAALESQQNGTTVAL